MVAADPERGPADPNDGSRPLDALSEPQPKAPNGEGDGEANCKGESGGNGGGDAAYAAQDDATAGATKADLNVVKALPCAACCHAFLVTFVCFSLLLLCRCSPSAAVPLFTASNWRSAIGLLLRAA